jgi:hypothetical protein
MANPFASLFGDDDDDFADAGAAVGGNVATERVRSSHSCDTMLPFFGHTSAW